MESRNEEIVIGSNSLIMDIQKAFTACYPFLKMEFLQKEGNTHRSTTVHPNTALKRFEKGNAPYRIDISGSRIVSGLSREIGGRLGLIVQLFRKSGNIWNVISLTEGWTLERQNAAGAMISQEIGEAPAQQ